LRWIAPVLDDVQAFIASGAQWSTVSLQQSNWARAWQTEHFVKVEYPSLYAKIARRHGFDLKMVSPMISRKWLPVESLPQYPDPYSFMERYTIGGSSFAAYNKAS
jgi:hypothetical protein